jgi:multiple sugar transport system substrate-binding protein
VSVQASDVPKKLQTTIASGGELPDIIRIERGQRPKLLEMNVLENLEQAPYNVNKSLLFDYDIAVNQNAEGKLVSIPDDMSLAGIAYLKDLAKQYFGTDDPKQLEAMLPTWDVVIEKGKEISRNSGGKVKLFASLGDVWQIARGQRSGPFFDGDKLNTNVLGDVLNKIVKFRDADLVDKLDQFTPAWNASFGLDKYMFYPSPVWLPQYVIGPNDKTGKARWGLMVPPEGGFIWGGSGHGILKGAKNKEAAFKWIEFVSMTQDGAEALKKDGVFTHYKKAYDDPSFAEWKWQNFGDQNIGEKYFKDISAKTKDISENTNDTLLSEAMNIVLKTLAQDHSFTVEKAMDKIKQELKAKNAKITF